MHIPGNIKLKCWLTLATEYNGRYLEDSEVTPKEKIRAWARDEIEAERLWKLSEEIVGQGFAY